MDSIPQELIDAIIDNIPESSLPSCSLVAKRWRRKSQQRVLATISFPSERKVKRWCTDIPRDSNGISSYVRHVTIEEICSWVEPALLGQMLESLSSLTTVEIFATEIPDELPGHISRGESGKRITSLDLCVPYCTFVTLTSMILSLPNLKELRVGECDAVSEGPLPTYSVTPQSRPLDSLELYGCVDGIGETLARFQFTSSYLSLDVGITNIEQLLLLSSETVVELNLCDGSADGIPPPIRLPSLPLLTTLVIEVYVVDPSPHLTNILFSIDSAPALSSITIRHVDWKSTEYLCLGVPWVDVDRWLSQIAKHTKVTGGLLLTLGQWPEGEPVWEEFLPEFRKSGGKIKVDDGRDTGDWELGNPLF